MDNFGGVVFQVRVLDDDDVSSRHGEAFSQCRRFPGIFLVNDPDSRVFSGQALGDLARAITGPVIDDDYFEVKWNLEHPADDRGDGALLVVRRHDDGKRHGIGIGGSSSRHLKD